MNKFNIPKIILIVLFIIVLSTIIDECNLFKNYAEHYNSGTLLQLYAKGPQDRYLTNSDYIWPYYYFNPSYYGGYRHSYYNHPYNQYRSYRSYGGYRPQEYVWNNPTRYPRGYGYGYY